MPQRFGNFLPIFTKLLILSQIVLLYCFCKAYKAIVAVLHFSAVLAKYQLFVVGKGWRNLAELAALSVFGPKEDAVCVNCEGRTRGPLCHQCAPGRYRENISRGPTFGDFVTSLREGSMQDITVTGLQSTGVRTPLSIKLNVLRESLSKDSQNIPCAALKKRGSWVISVYIWPCCCDMHCALSSCLCLTVS